MTEDFDHRVTPAFHPDTFTALDGYNEDSAKFVGDALSAFTAAYHVIGKIHDATEIGKRNGAWTEEQRILAVGKMATAEQAEKPKGWYAGMPSPNPKGRPAGITDRKAKLAQRMLADADGIVGVMVDKALEGDSGAASLILSRVIPPLRGQTERVQFDFDPTAGTAQQIEAVLAAIASGGVSADVGRGVIAAIGTLSNARAVEDLEARIITLEARQV